MQTDRCCRSGCRHGNEEKETGGLLQFVLFFNPLPPHGAGSDIDKLYMVFDGLENLLSL